MLRLLPLVVVAVGCDGSQIDLTPLVFGDLCEDATFAPVTSDALEPETRAQLDELLAAQGEVADDVLWSDDLADTIAFALAVEEGTLVQRTGPNDFCPEAVFTTVNYTVTTESGRLDLAASGSVDLENAFRNGELQLNHALAFEESAPIRTDLALDEWQDVWMNLGSRDKQLTNVEVAYSTSQTSTLCRRAAVLASKSASLDANCD
ncbi:MAG: hypothetical protein AAGA48_01990 [Myxococcota bacterium]